MKLYIKHMVSLRCKMMVEEEFQKLGIHPLSVNLGMVELVEALTSQQKIILAANLKKSGLELMSNQKSILIEQIKSSVIELVHYSDELPKMNSSEFISKKLGYVYAYLANLFSEVQGMTIQQFIILNKIERVKELLSYGELNLTEISYKLHYSSVAHLSGQFKKITGLTPSLYIKQKNKGKQTLESL